MTGYVCYLLLLFLKIAIRDLFQMQSLRRLGILTLRNTIRKHPAVSTVIYKHETVTRNNLRRAIHCSACLFVNAEEPAAVPLRSRKRKSESENSHHFIDIKAVIYLK